MATQVQRRRGTESENDAFTGALAEWVYDTTNDEIRTHDGTRQGGYNIANMFGLQNQRFTSSDAVQDTSGNYTVTLAVAPTAYAKFQTFIIKPDANNTDACDINVNSLGLKNLQKYSDGTLTELEADDLVADNLYIVSYDGTRFLLISNVGGTSLTEYGVQTATSGTDVTFSSLPSSASFMIMPWQQVSVSSTGQPIIRIGDSGGIETTGYDSIVSKASSATSTAYTTSYGGPDDGITTEHSGVFLFVKTDSANNTWNMSGLSMTRQTTIDGYFYSGYKSLSAALTQIEVSVTAGAFNGADSKLNLFYI